MAEDTGTPILPTEDDSDELSEEGLVVSPF